MKIARYDSHIPGGGPGGPAAGRSKETCDIRARRVMRGLNGRNGFVTGIGQHTRHRRRILSGSAALYDIDAMNVMPL